MAAMITDGDARRTDRKRLRSNMELVTKYDPDRPQPDDDDYLSSDIEQDYAEQLPTRRKVDTAIAAVAKLTEQMRKIQATLAEMGRRQEQAQVQGGKGGPPSQQGQGGKGGKGGKGGYPQQSYQGGQPTMQGRGAPPPMPCAYCTRRGQDANHEYKHCQHYVGCGICKGPGHYSKECVLPCPGCGQASLIQHRRHKQGCYKMPS